MSSSESARRERIARVDLLEAWPPPEHTLDAWRALAVGRENLFVTPEWCGAWLATEAGERPLILRACDQHGDLVGILPLVRATRGPARILRYAGGRSGDWFEPVCARGDETDFARACAPVLAGLGSSWHAIVLDRLEADSAWPEALLPNWPLPRPGPVRRREDVLPFIEFDHDGFDGYLAGRSRNFRSQLGRRRRRLEREHRVEYRSTEHPEQLMPDLDDFFRLHDLRWSDRGGSGALNPTAKRFHTRFARSALERGWLRLWIMEVDGRPVASWYGWRVGSRYCYCLSGFDPAWADAGVGTVMLAHTIEQAAKEGCRIYDLMWGDEAYKSRFETGRRRAESYILPRPRHVATPLARGLEWARRRARRLPPQQRARLRAAARVVRR